MAKTWLCRIGKHRWQRLRNPKAAGTANAADAKSNASPAAPVSPRRRDSSGWSVRLPAKLMALPS
jgi:hypothetical protein